MIAVLKGSTVTIVRIWARNPKVRTQPNRPASNGIESRSVRSNSSLVYFFSFFFHTRLLLMARSCTRTASAPRINQPSTNPI